MAIQSAVVYDESFSANADLSAKQYFAVKLTATRNQVALVAAATDRPFGLLQNKPNASGRAASVRILGRSKAVTDGSGTAIAIGDYVGPDANGRLIKKSTADNVVVGIALDASSALGAVIDVLLIPGAFFRTAA